MCISNGRHHLLGYLQEPYLSVICVTLGGAHQDHPFQIFRDSPVLPHRLYQLQKFHTFRFLGGVVTFFNGYASASHVLKCLLLSCVCTPSLFYSGDVLRPPLMPPTVICRKFEKGRRGWGLVSLDGAVTLAVMSCSSPIWDNLPSGHQRYPLFGLNLGYMYWGQKQFSE